MKTVGARKSDKRRGGGGVVQEYLNHWPSYAPARCVDTCVLWLAGLTAGWFLLATCSWSCSWRCPAPSGSPVPVHRASCMLTLLDLLVYSPVKPGPTECFLTAPQLPGRPLGSLTVNMVVGIKVRKPGDGSKEGLSCWLMSWAALITKLEKGCVQNFKQISTLVPDTDT